MRRSTRATRDTGSANVVSQQITSITAELSAKNAPTIASADRSSAGDNAFS